MAHSIAVIIPATLVQHLRYKRGSYIGIEVLDDNDTSIQPERENEIKPTSRLILRLLQQDTVIERDA